jgi:hypothetical protein
MRQRFAQRLSLFLTPFIEVNPGQSPRQLAGLDIFVFAVSDKKK